MDASERILAEVIKQIGTGAGVPTVRTVAAAAGVSPALVLYRFGDMAGVREAALQTALEQEETVWARRREVYLAAAITVADLPGLLCELLNMESETMPDLGAVRWLRCFRSLRGSERFEPGIIATQEVHFWNELAERTGVSPAARQLIMQFYQGLAFGHVIAQRRPGFQAWSNALVHRFTQRLLGGAPGEVGSDSAFRAAVSQSQNGFGVETSATMHPTRQDILNAAMNILVEEGVANVTHRRLASAAKASASSVIHFFESRQSLLKEAYIQLYVRLRTRSLDSLGNAARADAPLTARQLAEGLQPPAAANLLQNEADLAGLLNAMFEASRDAELSELAMAMFANTGSASRQLLTRLEGCRGHIGWLDAQILRLVTNGQVMLRHDPKVSASDEADHAGYVSALQLLFGPAEFSSDTAQD